MLHHAWATYSLQRAPVQPAKYLLCPLLWIYDFLKSLWNSLAQITLRSALYQDIQEHSLRCGWIFRILGRYGNYISPETPVLHDYDKNAFGGLDIPVFCNNVSACAQFHITFFLFMARRLWRKADCRPREKMLPMHVLNCQPYINCLMLLCFSPLLALHNSHMLLPQICFSNIPLILWGALLALGTLRCQANSPPPAY